MGQTPPGGVHLHPHCQSTWTSVAVPWPTPMQAAATPYPPPRRRSSRHRSTTTRGAEAPSGWPIAIAPPCGFTRSRSIAGSSWRQESTIAANASLISHTATSSTRRPARSSSFEIAGTGATENRSGSTATVTLPTSWPSGSTPSSPARPADPSSTAIAPSLIGEELPAVTVPPLLNAGLRAARASSEVEGRIDSSRVTASIGMTYSWRFFCQASAVRWWLRRDHSSCSARPMPSSAATDSAQAPSERVQRSGNAGLTSRQPTWVWCSCIVRGSASSGLGSTYGARLMLSTPPAITTEASPTAIARAAWTRASPPEAQSRLTVTPGTVTGRPASSAAILATLRLSSPAPLVSPRITSSTVAGSSPGTRLTSSAIGSAARSSVRIPDSPPRCLPNGVRTASMRYASMPPSLSAAGAPRVCGQLAASRHGRRHLGRKPPKPLREQRDHVVADHGDQRRAGEGQDPGPDDVAGDAPAHRGQPLGGADAHDRRGDRVGGRDRGAEADRGHVQHRTGGGFGGEALRWVQVDHPATERTDDPPAARVRPERQHRGGEEVDPERDVLLAGLDPAGVEREHHDAHRLGGVLHAVAERHAPGRNGLRVPEAPVQLAWVAAPEQPRHGEHHQIAEPEPDQGRDHHRDDDLLDYACPEDAGATDRGGAHQAPDQGVRRGGGQSVIPGDQVPGDRADQRRHHQHQAVEPGGRVDDALADGARHLGAEERPEQVADRGQHQRRAGRQRPGRHRRGDRVGGVVEPVGVVEAHREDDDRDDPDELGTHRSGLLHGDGLDGVGDVLERVCRGLQLVGHLFELEYGERVVLAGEE